jgi:putative methyltransferase (TIGR04325 family)
MGLRELARPLRRMRRLLGQGLRFDGDYRSWEDAQRASGGYADETIARKMCDAELTVKRGGAADARDGVTFDQIQYSLPVMAALGRIAKPRLRVIDFGGAFGASYRHYRTFHGRPAAWSVVEQPAMAGLGKAHFQDAELDFHASLEAALAAGPADAILLSSALQYLPAPYDLIGRLRAAHIPRVIIDRTPCSAQERDILTVQKVPAEIYAASYPCWIFSRARLLEAFAPDYATVASFSDGSGTWYGQVTEFELAGFILDAR